MRRGILLSIDLLLVALATASALVLRDNFEIRPDRLVALLPYLLVSLGVAAGVFLAGRLDRTLWRYSSFPDYLHIVVLSLLVVLLAVGAAFAINRLEGIPRSLPVLQGVLTVSALVAARVGARVWFGRPKSANGRAHSGRD